MHALDRLNEQYGANFTKKDLFTIIKKGLYLEIVNDFLPKTELLFF